MFVHVCDNWYLIAHLWTRVDVEAQVVEGQLWGLFLQLPGERNLPVKVKKSTLNFRRKASHIQHSIISK